MSVQNATIDGQAVTFDPGESILTAARRLGVEIPTLCYHPDLAPEGGCRLCLVDTNRGRRAACCTPLEPGLTVQTATLELEALRRDVLSLVLAERGPGIFHPDPEGDELEALAARLGVSEPTFGYLEGRENGRACHELDASHPYLRFNPERCITCRRCQHACEEIQGQFVYAVAGRGATTRLVFGAGESFAESPCVACGACVDVCPTHALSDRDRFEPSVSLVTYSVCGYCGVGCRVAVYSKNGRVTGIDGVPDAAVNRGHLCVKGRYAHAYHHSEDRLTRPLLRAGDGFREISWEEALGWLAERLVTIRDQPGPQALGVFTSSRSTNEAAYLLQKLFRTTLGTNNVDCCARVCHASTALALQLVTGTGAATASYDDVEKARAILIAGANPTEAHPVIGARLKQAALRGVPMVVVDPRRIELAEYAAVHLQLRPGTNVPLFNALARVLIEDELIDRAYLDERVDGFEAFERFLHEQPLREAARLTGVPMRTLRRAARLLGEAGPVLFVHGLGLSELTQGTASVMTLANLAMLTGSIGRPGAGMLPLRGQNNVQGNVDMGSAPSQTTGYQRLDDEAVRAHLAEVWGTAPPRPPGLTIPEMIDAAARGELRGLWIQGEDVAQSDPNQHHVIAALERLELLVVQELFLSETARYAHLVLPAASVLEQWGTFTNGERRIQLVRPAVPPPGEARPDWEVVRDLGRVMGEAWDYPTPAEVMEEIARVAPRLFGGVSYDRLEGDGLQWPCPENDHPGTATVHANGFLRGKGQLVAIDFVPSPEHGVAGYPYLLVTGRVLDHYNVGTMTRRTPSRELVAEDRLEIHPQDAEREGLAEGDRIELASRWGRTTVSVLPSRRVAPGTLFLPFHFPETRTNALTGPHGDPQSKCPEYKVTAVRIGGR